MGQRSGHSNSCSGSQIWRWKLRVSESPRRRRLCRTSARKPAVICITSTRRMPVRARPPFPKVVDSTMLATARSCYQKFFQTYMEHWKPQGESIHLHAGRCFSNGLEMARREHYEWGKDPEESIGRGLVALTEEWGDFQAPEGTAKTLERMLGALEFYFDAYPLDTDKATPMVMPSGKRGIEFSFAEPLS